MKIKPGKNAKGRGISEHAAYYVGRATRASLAFVVCGVVLVLLWRGWFPDLRAPGADLRRVGGRGAVDRAAGDQDRGARAHRRAAAHAAARGGVGRRARAVAADDGLPAAGVFGRRRLGGLPAGLRGGQLPGDVSPAGRRAAAGGDGDRLRGGDLLRPGAPPEAPGAFAGHAGFIAVFALLNVVFLHAEVARQRREHRRRVEKRSAAMREEARDFRLISTALSRREPRAHPRGGAGEAVAGSIQTIHQQLYHNLDLLRAVAGAADVRAAVAGRERASG